VPDESSKRVVYTYVNPNPAEWPAADFIVGNPPFIGPARMRAALGDGYAERPCARSTPKSPRSTSGCMSA
jgi:hypothetical protein